MIVIYAITSPTQIFKKIARYLIDRPPRDKGICTINMETGDAVQIGSPRTNSVVFESYGIKERMQRDAMKGFRDLDIHFRS